MSEPGKHTYPEIVGQAEAWTEALQVAAAAGEPLRRLWRDTGARRLLFIGCGSTYYLSLAAAALARAQGLAAR
ncbi:MAG: SIS domain-containing protein, partial [Anaerolineae bacterium]